MTCRTRIRTKRTPISGKTPNLGGYEKSTLGNVFDAQKELEKEKPCAPITQRTLTRSIGVIMKMIQKNTGNEASSYVTIYGEKL